MGRDGVDFVLFPLFLPGRLVHQCAKVIKRKRKMKDYSVKCIKILFLLKEP